jgi:hypothetical protein
MYSGTGGPAKHEVSHRQENDAIQSGNETVFLCSKAVLHDVRDQIFELVDKENRDANDAGDSDAYKAKTSFAKIEVINWWVDECESFEEGIVDAVGKRCLLLS